MSAPVFNPEKENIKKLPTYLRWSKPHRVGWSLLRLLIWSISYFWPIYVFTDF